jgi:hypothetical protein
MSVWILREDFDEAAKYNGHLMTPKNVLEDAWQDFTTFSGTMAEFHKDRKVRCPHRYVAPVADTSEHEALLYSAEEQRKYATAHSVEELASILEANGLKLGHVKKQPKADPAEMEGDNNPYSDGFLKTHTPAQREAKIHSLLATTPTLAQQLSAKAGKNLMGQKLVSAAERFATERDARVAAAADVRAGEKR